MLAEVDRMQDALEEMVEVISRHQDALFAIYRDYDSTREEIEDETRAERVLNIMKNSTDSISDRLKEVNDALEDWRDADRNPSTGHEEFEQALAQVGTYRETAQQIGVDAMFALRAEMSREEWIAVFGDGS